MADQEWEESQPVDLNWIEHVRNALKSGKLTTIITFDSCQYMVTLQPYRAPSYRAGLNTDGRPVTMNRPYQHGKCHCGTLITWLVGQQRWDHTKGKPEGHVAWPAGFEVPTATAAHTVQEHE